MFKQLDQIKKLTQLKAELSYSEDVKNYIEAEKQLNSLKSVVRGEIASNLIIKPSGFGIPKTFKSWTDANMVDAHITKDRKQVIGILKGDKVLADVRLQHFAPKEVKAYSAFSIKGWVGK